MPTAGFFSKRGEHEEANEFYDSLSEPFRQQLQKLDSSLEWCLDLWGRWYVCDEFGDRVNKTVSGIKRRISGRSLADWTAREKKREEMYQEGLKSLKARADSAADGSGMRPRPPPVNPCVSPTGPPQHLQPSDGDGSDVGDVGTGSSISANETNHRLY